MVRGFVIFNFYITTSQVVRGGVQVNRDEVIEEKGPLFEVDYHSILLSLWSEPLLNLSQYNLRINLLFLFPEIPYVLILITHLPKILPKINK